MESMSDQVFIIAGLPDSLRAQLRKSAQPQWVSPMLATLTDEPFSRRGWLFEPKLDGERCLVWRHGDHVQLYSRNQKSLNEKYPELVRGFQIQRTTTVFIVDGEIVTFERGVTSFAKLQQRMQLQHPSVELRRKIPVSFYAFDLLYLDGYDTRQLALRYRKKVLRAVLDFEEPLRFTEHRETEGEAYFEESCRRGWEGVVAKNGESVYLSRRSRDWLKFKCTNEQEFVIGGYTDPKGERTGFGALLVGYYDAGKLIYVGKVGTGYDTTTLRRLGKQLSQLETTRSPFAGASSRGGTHWVRPQLVAQIAFAEWTAAGKLRQPRFLGLRTDKRPEEVIREK
jgi:bifunctional non-homologous end joining protein LigD